MARRDIGRPKGVDETAQVARDSLLASRFRAVPEPIAPIPRRGRADPQGMTRRTVYLSIPAAATLDQAINRVQQATGGKVAKHEILAALITASVDQVDTVAAHLRAELLRQLGAE